MQTILEIITSSFILAIGIFAGMTLHSFLFSFIHYFQTRAAREAAVKEADVIIAKLTDALKDDLSKPEAGRN